jgi:iron-sulfur cluster repair protein YtfE (RIC family)
MLMNTPPHDAHPPETISSYLASDHARLDALLDEVADGVADGRFAEARAVWESFQSALLRHLRIEEELVFPVFEMRSGMSHGPTVALRHEHGQIRRIVALLAAALGREDAGAFRDALAFLDTFVADHESREEHVLFPTTDGLLTPAECARFVDRLRRE